MKKYNIQPVKSSLENTIQLPTMKPSINTIMEESNTTEMQVIHDDYVDTIKENIEEAEEVLEEEIL